MSETASTPLPQPPGRSRPFLFHVETKKVPGRTWYHCVQFVTYEFETAKDKDIEFHLLDEDVEPRLKGLRQTLLGGGK